MTVIDYLKTQIELFDTQKKCGFCWSFYAPLSDSGMNATKPNEEEVCCCVHVYVTDWIEGQRSQYLRDNTMSNIDYIDTTLTVKFVMNTNLGINVFNEQDGHPIEESHYEKILKPIRECLNVGREFDFCETPYRLESFIMRKVLLTGDQNYTGWSATMQIREYLRQ